MRTIKVLHVDDEEPLLEVAAHFLRKVGGFEVFGATSVRKAFEMLREGGFDVVVSDYQMPETDGIEFLRRLRSDGSDIPFILLTGKGREDVAIEALNQGADFYLQKGRDLRSQFHELANMITQAVESRRSQRVLAESQERFRKLADGITDLFLGLTGEMRVTYWNKAVEDFLGIRSRDAVGKGLFELVPELVGTRTEAIMRRALANGKREVEVIDVEMKGARRWLEVNAYPSEDGLSVLIRDATLRVTAERSLRESEERYRAVVESAPVGIVIISGDTVVYANPAARRLYGGQEPADLAGKAVSELIHPDDLQSAVSRLGAVLGTGFPSAPEEMRFFRKDGRQLVMEVSSSRIVYMGEPAVQTTLLDVTGRRAAEERLRHQEEELRTMLDSVPAMISYQDEEGRIIRVNRSFEEATGVSADRCRGRTLAEVFPDFSDTMSANDRRVLETGEPSFGIISPFRSKDGVRWAKTDKIPYREGAGNTVGVITISDDITDMLESERRASRLSVLLDSIEDAVVFVDLDLVIESWSGSAEAMYGWSSREAVGRKLTDLLSTMPIGTGMEAMLERMGEAGRVRFDAREKRKDGSVVYTEYHAVPLRGDSGDVVGYATVNRDVSDRVRAEAALRRSEERFMKAFRASPVMVTMTRVEDGTVLDVNDTFQEMTGFTADEVVGRTSVELGVITEETRRELMSAFETEGCARGLLLPFRTKSGSERLAEVSAEMIEVEDERMALIVASDVTDRRNYEDALRKVNRKLNLLGSVTRHDALNQLGLLRGWLSVAMEQVEDPSLRSMLERVENASEALRRHLEFTAQYKSLGMKRPDWIDLVGLVSRISPDVERQGMAVEVDLDAIELYADPMLENVFRNLVNNSIAHGGKVTRVSFTHEARDGALLVIYEDDGVGVPAEDKERVFERGFGKRSGYGLYLSAEILSITGMGIREEGVPGEGARFVISVPPSGHRRKASGATG